MITAIVPARSGSKRLPGKNIKLLNGRPLIFYTIDALLGHPQVNEILFTTDSEKYSDIVSQEYGDKVSIIMRPEEYGKDSAKVHQELVRLAVSNLISNDWFILCLPTAPLRNFETIKRALSRWNKDFTPLFSASEYNFPIQFSFNISGDGNWSPVFKNTPMLTGNTRSQDISVMYRPNGAIYLHKTSSLTLNTTFYIDAKPFLISDREAIDVDTIYDFKLVEIILKDK
jgi:CMP-N,N'-diacetyllegionaminic acid synthase